MAKERNSYNIIVSGAVDTNVKLWDIRTKQCVNTYKGHKEDISCLDISPDSKMIASGSMDGTVRFWDAITQRMVKQIKVSSTGYPTCISFNPKDICVAIGLSNKCIKYYELDQFNLISSTSIELLPPRAL